MQLLDSMDHFFGLWVAVWKVPMWLTLAFVW